MIYEPAEDSYLLQKAVRRYAQGRVLDIGTGSGIQALTAARKRTVRSVLAVDIDNEVISFLRSQKLSKKITVRQSDLFSHVPGTFDTIICNPPYLPQDPGVTDWALYGGKKGYELLERFLREVGDYLTEKGRILIVFSSLTNKERVDDVIQQQLFQFRELSRQKLAFEELYCYIITPAPLRKRLTQNNVTDIHYFARGKRGLIYTSHYHKKKVAVKVPRPGSQAKGRMANEARWLRVVNKDGLGPRLLFAGRGVVVYSFVAGQLLKEIIDHAAYPVLRRVFHTVLQQCFQLDQLGIQKEEMHRPQKHIILGTHGQVTLIDFERCYRKKNPHNVTQFVEFICRTGPLLVQKGFVLTVPVLRQTAQAYASKRTEESFQRLLRLVR